MCWICYYNSVVKSLGLPNSNSSTEAVKQQASQAMGNSKGLLIWFSCVLKPVISVAEPKLQLQRFQMYYFGQKKRHLDYFYPFMWLSRVNISGNSEVAVKDRYQWRTCLKPTPIHNSMISCLQIRNQWLPRYIFFRVVRLLWLLRSLV